jgi:hypothetical protein
MIESGRVHRGPAVFASAVGLLLAAGPATVENVL